jgi:methylglutaconyl-CoA hydratase
MANNLLLTKLNDNGLMTLTLNRPDILNAFDDQLINELSTTFDSIEKDKNIRVVVLNAAGKHFCAGGDLNWMKRMASYSYAENLADAQRLATMLNKLYSLSKPTIALVQGSAFGGGVGLVACCDIAIATTTANFCLSEVKIGLIPSVISPYVITAIGERAAHRYFLTAESFDAQEAHRLGLVHSVVTENDLTIAGEKIIHQLLKNSPAALTAAKQLLTDVTRSAINSSLIEETAKRIADIRVSKEGQEGLAAFLEKRKPKWLSKS